MLPCQSSCPAYCPGCHKTCARWKRFQQEQREERQAKKQYLRFYMTLCDHVTRQYRAMQVRRPAW